MKKIHKKVMKDYHKTYKPLHWVLLVAFLTAAVFFVGKNVTDFRASVIPTESPSPYDGTTLPVLKVPKWTSLSSDQYKLNYDQIPADKLIPLPKYDPDILKTSTESLGWKSESDLNIRNAKITFSTPYMGNYKLDGLENAGSHLAVDIKVPNDTPVYAIGNGIVVKVSDQASGFGKHIVIKHVNFPALNDPNAKTTLYSSYNHLGEVLIAEGDVVNKGDLIAKSGHSGTATTPHVHFQIDNDLAPWHPYWPFTYQEASAAGLDFTSAINSGLGKEKALQMSVNPLMYVQKYLNGSAAASSSTPPPSPTPAPPPSSVPDELPPVQIPPPTPTPEIIQPSDPIAPPSSPGTDTAISFVIGHDGSFVPNVAETFTLEAVDASGGTVNYLPQGNIFFQILSGEADLPDALSANEFINGKATFQVTPHGEAALKIKATDNVISGESDVMQLTQGEVFTDISPESPSFRAISFLKDQNVIGGYPDGSFKGKAVVSRVEALKFILNGVNSPLLSDSTLPFKDTKVREWYTDYVATAYSKSIVEGYPDFTFKPGKDVNKVEFLKMLLLAMNVSVDPVVTEDVYADVPKDAWFASYVKYAKDKNLIEVKGGKFRPEDGMSRTEVAETIYRMIMVKVSDADQYTSDVDVSLSRVREYFS